ncbi:hypothetical protein HYU09_04235 [Candidatus Woesearchaeota archaeon]|nr:hypothetical protein [Candidatus Woesearchaeota archaeon]
MQTKKPSKDELIVFFSEFWKIDQDEVTDKLELNSKSLPGFDSLRLFQFFAAVEFKFKVKIKKLNSIRTFGELFNNI